MFLTVIIIFSFLKKKRDMVNYAKNAVDSLICTDSEMFLEFGSK